MIYGETGSRGKSFGPNIITERTVKVGGAKIAKGETTKINGVTFTKQELDATSDYLSSILKSPLRRSKEALLNPQPKAVAGTPLAKKKKKKSLAIPDCETIRRGETIPIEKFAKEHGKVLPPLDLSSLSPVARRKEEEIRVKESLKEKLARVAAESNEDCVFDVDRAYRKAVPVKPVKNSLLETLSSDTPKIVKKKKVVAQTTALPTKPVKPVKPTKQIVADTPSTPTKDLIPSLWEMLDKKSQAEVPKKKKKKKKAVSFSEVLENTPAVTVKGKRIVSDRHLGKQHTIYAPNNEVFDPRKLATNVVDIPESEVVEFQKSTERLASTYIKFLRKDILPHIIALDAAVEYTNALIVDGLARKDVKVDSGILTTMKWVLQQKVVEFFSSTVKSKFDTAAINALIGELYKTELTKKSEYEPTTVGQVAKAIGTATSRGKRDGKKDNPKA